MKKFYFTALVIAFSFITIYGQNNYSSGYLLKNNGDTLYGLINDRGDLKNSIECLFKADKNKPENIYKPFDIEGYRFANGSLYKSVMIEKDSTLIPVFLECLVDGIADLYYYKDTEDNNFFIRDKSGNLMNLSNKSRTVEIETDKIHGFKDKYEVESKEYIGTLTVAFSDCKQIGNELQKIRLDHNSLIDITEKYHNYVCDGEKCIIYRKTPWHGELAIGPLLSFRYTHLAFPFQEEVQDLQYDAGLNFSAGFSARTNIPSLTRLITFQLTASLGRDYYYGYGYEQNPENEIYYYLHYRAYSLNTDFIINYTIPREGFRPYFGIGMGLKSDFDIDYRIIEEERINNSIWTNDIPELFNKAVRKKLILQAGFEFHEFNNLLPYAGIKYENLFYGHEWTIFNLSFNTGFYFKLY